MTSELNERFLNLDQKIEVSSQTNKLKNEELVRKFNDTKLLIND